MDNEEILQNTVWAMYILYISIKAILTVTSNYRAQRDDV